MNIVRAVQYANTTSNRGATYVFRFMYEFWCYVVNKPSSPTVPGGVPGVAYTTFPTNSLEGTTVLATGTDGATTVDALTFDSASANFASSVIGKHLVVWGAFPDSGEDGIYQILGRPSSTQLVLNVANGGSPHPTTFRPRFTTRTGLKYRIVDISAVGALAGWADDQYFVMQMTPSIYNVGQANSQIQWKINNATGLSGGSFTGSPAGTWTGSAFTDAMAEVFTTSNSNQWFSTGGGTTIGAISLWGDRAGMIAYFKDQSVGSSGYVYLEAPNRLASQAQDPNPLIIATDGVCTIHVGSLGFGFNNFWMAGTDGVARRHRMLVKCLSGDGNGETGRPTATLSFMGDSRLSVAPTLNKTFTSPIVLGQVGSPNAQFNFSRAIMRMARICPNNLPSWIRVGDGGEFLHIQNGVCWPWDNVILGSNLIPLGF
jgi:hypothetical protein